MSAPTVFVCSITGAQGKPLALQLRQLGWTVKGTSRTSDSPAAKELEAAGVHISQADWDDVASLKAAMSGAQKIFLCTMSYIDDPDRERRQALNIVQAAKEAGIEQVALSGSIGVFTIGGPPLVPFYEMIVTIKKAIEQAILDAGFTQWTFIRPAVFMSNVLAPQVDYFFPGLRTEGVVKSVMQEGQKVALVEPSDISKLAAVVLENPDKYNGREIGFSSVLMTVPEILAELAKITGKTDFTAHYMTEEEIDEQKGSFSFMLSERALRKQESYVDLEELASTIELRSFSDFLEKEKDKVIATYS